MRFDIQDVINIKIYVPRKATLQSIVWALSYYGYTRLKGQGTWTNSEGKEITEDVYIYECSLPKDVQYLSLLESIGREFLGENWDEEVFMAVANNVVLRVFMDGDADYVAEL